MMPPFGAHPGSASVAAHEMALRRIEQAGVKLIGTAGIQFSYDRAAQARGLPRR